MGIIDTTPFLNTASTGNYTEYYDGDGSAHTINTRAAAKAMAGAAEPVVFQYANPLSIPPVVRLVQCW